MGSDIYYKIYASPRFSGLLTIVCMQWFDEYDYDEDRFFTDEDGHVLEFSAEEEAINWLNENIRVEMIDPEYRRTEVNRSYYLK